MGMAKIKQEVIRVQVTQKGVCYRKDFESFAIENNGRMVLTKRQAASPIQMFFFVSFFK